MDNLNGPAPSSLDFLWNATLEELEKALPAQTYSTWIHPIQPLHLLGDVLTLQVPNKFFAHWLQDQGLSTRIQSIISSIGGRSLSVNLLVQQEEKGFLGPRSSRGSPRTKQGDWAERAKKAGLNPKYTFETFVVGSSNQFAHAAGFAVAEKSPRTYNPLFIYGGVGLGKTHLLNAIGNHKFLTDPTIKVCYIHSESFINELIQSLANKRMPEFREKYRKMDILLMDDIQFIAGKERTQEEFFHTFNSLYERQKNIVVTSDRFPKDIPGLEDRLRSRFEWGLIADIQPPDLETKIAILQKKAEFESIPLSYEVASFLGSNFSSNIRELEGSLVRVSAFASLTHSQITVDLAREVLRDFIRETAKEPTVENILKAVAEHFSIAVSDLKGKRRTKALAHPRQIAMHLAREMTSSSFPEIGQKIGGRDHSTVMYAHTKVSEALKTDRALQHDVQSIRSTLGRKP